MAVFRWFTQEYAKQCRGHSNLGNALCGTRERMMALGRWLVRAVLAIILFGLACSALLIISLVAMYWDWRRLVHSGESMP